ncbi:MAG: tetratricopeptide repeat protein [Melioribacteraceae bacterium]|nr:tetratricopeptide repeat protein [Melioribacteraceae bacterium]
MEYFLILLLTIFFIFIIIKLNKKSKNKYPNSTSSSSPSSANKTDRTTLKPEVELEKQYALTLNVSELRSIVNGDDVWTAIGYANKIHVSKEVARKAIPVVQMIMDGDSLVSRNDLDGALKKYNTAIAKEPKCAIAHMAIGTVYSFKGDYASALKWTRIAADLDPLNGRIKNNLDIAEANFKDASSGEMENRINRSSTMLATGIVRHVETKMLPSVIPSILGGAGKDIYEVYETSNLSDAREYLAGLIVTEQQKYIVVETPDGPIGMDKNGMYNPSKNWRGDDWNKF